MDSKLYCRCQLALPNVRDRCPVFPPVIPQLTTYYLVSKGNHIDFVCQIKPQNTKCFCLIYFRVQVIAHYSLVNANQPYEIQAKSAVITYTTLGPPHAPTLKVLNSDMYQVCIFKCIFESRLQDKVSDFNSITPSVWPILVRSHSIYL